MIAENTRKILKNKMAANKQEFAHFYFHSKKITDTYLTYEQTDGYFVYLFVLPSPIIANVIYVLLTLYWPIQLKAQKDIYDFLIRGLYWTRGEGD